MFPAEGEQGAQDGKESYWVPNFPGKYTMKIETPCLKSGHFKMVELNQVLGPVQLDWSHGHELALGKRASRVTKGQWKHCRERTD